MDSSGNSHSNTVTVTVIDETLTVEEFSANDFKLYPNPTHNIFYLNFEREGEYSLLIFDILGKVLIQQNKLDTNSTFNLSNYSSGIYIVRIKDNMSNTFQSLKVVKK